MTPKENSEIAAATIEVREIAEVLDIGTNQVYAALNRGEIPAHRIGRRFVVPRRRFFAWFEGRTD